MRGAFHRPPKLCHFCGNLNWGLSTVACLFTALKVCNATGFIVDDSAQPVALSKWSIYDPRVRPWFRSATTAFAERNQTRGYSKVYRFAVTANRPNEEILGLTAWSVVSNGSAVSAILGIDFVLLDISKYLFRWYPDPTLDFSFVAELDWSLVAVSNGSAVATDGSRLTAHSFSSNNNHLAFGVVATLAAIDWPTQAATYAVRLPGSRILSTSQIVVANIRWIFCHVRVYKCEQEVNKYVSVELSNGGEPGCKSCPSGFAASADGSSCHVCPAGRYADTTNKNCEQCPIGRFSAAGSRECDDCGGSGRTSSASFDQCVCASGFVAKQFRCITEMKALLEPPKTNEHCQNSSSTCCHLCPAGGCLNRCEFGTETPIAAGWWHADERSTGKLFLCPYPAACEHGRCATGYHGPMCSACQDGYGKTSKGQCTVCELSRAVQVIMFCLGAVVVLAVFALVVKANLNANAPPRVVVRRHAPDHLTAKGVCVALRLLRCGSDAGGAQVWPKRNATSRRHVQSTLRVSSAALA